MRERGDIDPCVTLSQIGIVQHVRTEWKGSIGRLWHIKTRVSSDVRFDVRLWIVCQQAGGGWCVTGPSSHVTNCHDLSWLSHSSLHQCTIFRVTEQNQGPRGLLILCFIFLPSSLLFSGSNNCGVAVIRGEGIIPFWRNYVPGYNVTDLFSIEHSQPDQDTWAQTCLAKTLVRANPSNPEWSQEILWTLTSAESESASLDQKPT